MSTERIDRELVFNCDARGCNKNVGYDPDTSFEDAWTDAKSDGWVSTKQGDAWGHVCPSCSKKLGLD
jgi:hypothetical protein